MPPAEGGAARAFPGPSCAAGAEGGRRRRVGGLETVRVVLAPPPPPPGSAGPRTLPGGGPGGAGGRGWGGGLPGWRGRERECVRVPIGGRPCRLLLPRPEPKGNSCVPSPGREGALSPLEAWGRWWELLRLDPQNFKTRVCLCHVYF